MNKIVFLKTVSVKGVCSIQAGTAYEYNSSTLEVRVNNQNMCGTVYINVSPYIETGDALVINA
jgi:hypothetical protein